MQVSLVHLVQSEILDRKVQQDLQVPPDSQAILDLEEALEQLDLKVQLVFVEILEHQGLEELLERLGPLVQ